MKILILGAGGRTGRELIRTATGCGHEVTALVRREAALPAGVRVIPGGTNDLAALDAAMKGQEAVINAMGPRAGEDPQALTRALERIVVSMRQHHASRYVGISRAEIVFPGDEREYVGSIRDRLVRVWYGADFRAKADQADLLRRSGLEWSLGRVSRLIQGSAAGGYSVSLSTPPGGGLDRSDLALFLLDEVEAGRYVGCAPFVSSRQRSAG